MNVYRILISIILGILSGLSFSSVATSLAELHDINKGKFFLYDNSSTGPTYELVLAKNGTGKYARQTESQISWSKVDDGLQVNLASPELIWAYQDQGVEYRSEIYQVHVFPSEEGVSFAQHMRVVRTDTMEVVETQVQHFTGTLVPAKSMQDWRVDLTEGTWVLPAVDYILYEEFDIPAFGAVEANFFANGDGQITHHDKTVSRFKWRIKGNRLVLKYWQNGIKKKLVLRITELLAGVGLRVVIKATSHTGKAPLLRTGLMIKDQKTHFNYENTVGTWLRGAVRYDYFEDHVYIPNVAFGSAVWSFNQAGEIERQKIIHPQLGTVPVCPDDTCYVSCTFTLKLLAQDEGALYVSVQTDSELVDAGPHFFMGKAIVKFDLKPYQSVAAFDYSWLGQTMLTFKSGSESALYYFMMVPSETGVWEYVYAKEAPNNIQGKFAVVDGKLHLEGELETQVLEIQQSRRDSLDVCRYIQGSSCAAGDTMILEFHNGTDLLK
ncbi:hypothetical protein CWC22_021780 [Pseudoalteromonas rubra]|uniref:Uncharacterized protein n=1 Tax=Pseudoalteromonas rubra TaxID=43658 RepID=A0A5S3UU78_9GAMM|nr:hypothetical protein [Pseudoalteromonas rubra]QPB85642.1 hypothetical protein CWC22_021780 [Pseudoalteromonas rubra]